MHLLPGILGQVRGGKEILGGKQDTFGAEQVKYIHISMPCYKHY